MAMPEEIERGERAARKPHQCFDCYRTIPAGETYYYFTGKDDHVYTLRSHLDCHDAAMDVVNMGHWSDYLDGVPPLSDMLSDSGEFRRECDRLRGRFPHVVARLEMNEQESDIRWAAQLRERGIEPDPEDCQPVYG